MFWCWTRLNTRKGVGNQKSGALTISFQNIRVIRSSDPIMKQAESQRKERSFQLLRRMSTTLTRLGKNKMFSLCCCQRVARVTPRGRMNVVHPHSSQNTTLTPKVATYARYPATQAIAVVR